MAQSPEPVRQKDVHDGCRDVCVWTTVSKPGTGFVTAVTALAYLPNSAWT